MSYLQKHLFLLTFKLTGSTDIDIEMLLIEIQESWHRLAHYAIKVPVDAKMKLKALHCHFNRKLLH